MTQTEHPPEPLAPQQPTKRRKVEPDPDSTKKPYYQISQSHNRPNNNTNPHTNGDTPDPYAINGTLSHRPTNSSRNHPSSLSPSSRLPRVSPRDEDLRPPRRPSSITKDTVPPATSSTTTRASLQHQPTGLAPDVDAELQKIFATGLFERKDIDGRALDFLASVPPASALAALEDIQRRDFSTVRSKPAFIMSIFKRVVNSTSSLPSASQTTPSGAYAPTSVPPSALAHLPPAVSDALQRVFASGVCHPSQFDDRAMDILVDLQEPDAVRALSEFANMEPGRVRNPSAFWMGLARKFKGHTARISRMAPPGDGGPYRSYDGNLGYGSRRLSDPSMYATLDQRLDELSASGQLPRSVLDDRALDALRRLPEQDALAVLAELPEPAKVRNMSAYVMGLCKKFATGEARSLSGRSSSYGPPPYASGYGGPYSSGPSYGSSGPPYGSSAPYGLASGGPPPYSSSYGGYGSSYNVGSSNSAPSYGPPISQHNDSSRTREVRDVLDSMDPAVRDRFYSMTDRGIITETSFDARAISALQNMRREEACAALDELAASEPGRIHNISAYFMGLAKKFSRPPM